MPAALLKSNFLRNGVLAVASVALTTAALYAGYEQYGSYEYDRWHAQIQARGGHRQHFEWHVIVRSKDTKLIWEYRPNAEDKARRIKTNRFGFRQPDDVTLAKPAGATRVAFIGDSVTFGVMVDAADTFEQKYQDIVNKSHRTKVEALNFGVSGYDTTQIEEMLTTRVLPFSPDKIVYVMCLNDFDFDDSSGILKYYFKKPANFLAQKIKRFYMLATETGVDLHRYSFNRNKNVVFDSISRMERIAEKAKIKFSVIILPIFDSRIIDIFSRDRYDIKDYKSFKNYPIVDIHQKILAALQARHVQAIDLLSYFQKQNQPPKNYSFDLWHPNVAGDELIAQALAVDLTE